MTFLALIESEIERRKFGRVQPPETWAEFAAKTRIRSGTKLQAFKAYDYQILLADLIDRHYGVVATKARQLGLTEFVASWMLWRAKYDPSFLGVVFSKSLDDSMNIARRVRIACASHPDITLETENLKDLQLKDGGRLVFRPATPTSARGLESVGAILFDECAFVPNVDEIYSSALPATEMLGDAARIIILSTPFGQQGFYYQMLSQNNGDRDIIKTCQDVRTGRIDPVQYWTDTGGWCKFIVHWKAHPVYREIPDYLERQRVQKKMTLAQIFQEYDLGFEVSGSGLFPHEYVTAASIAEWQAPQFAHTYLISIDPSFGGGDFFTAHVWDISDPTVALVAEFRDHYKGKDYYLQQVYDLCDLYSPIAVGIETNSGGKLYAQQMAVDRPYLQVLEVNHTNTAKLVHTDRLVLMHEPRRQEIIYPADSALAHELEHFVEEVQGKTRIRHAESGHTDDAVMAAAVMAAILDEARLNLGDSSWVAGGHVDRSVDSVLSVL